MYDDVQITDQLRICKEVVELSELQNVTVSVFIVRNLTFKIFSSLFE